MGSVGLEEVCLDCASETSTQQSNRRLVRLHFMDYTLLLPRYHLTCLSGAPRLHRSLIRCSAFRSIEYIPSVLPRYILAIGLSWLLDIAWVRSRMPPGSL